MKKSYLKTISEWTNESLKVYNSPRIKHHLVDLEQSILVQSKEKTVSDSTYEKGLQATWEEEDITETFRW